MCTCNENFKYMDLGALTCTNCGFVFKELHFVPGFDCARDPLCVAVYERRKRFIDILGKVLLPTIDNKDLPMYKHLEGENVQYDSVGKLLAAMKVSGLIDKRYVSLRAFARFFLKGYKNIKCDTTRILEVSGRYFNMLESVYGRLYQGEPFFNYNWLIRKFLVKYKCTKLCRFVKPIKCPKRNKHYEQMFSACCTLLQAQDDEKKNRQTADVVLDGPETSLYQSITFLHVPAALTLETSENGSGTG